METFKLVTLKNNHSLDKQVLIWITTKNLDFVHIPLTAKTNKKNKSANLAININQDDEEKGVLHLLQYHK